jgi:hypothetical protein
MPPFVPKLCGEHLSGAIRMNFKVVEMVLKSKKSSEATDSEHQAAAIGSEWEFFGFAQNPCNRLKELVAGVGFEPTTFGLSVQHMDSAGSHYSKWSITYIEYVPPDFDWF